MLILLSPSKTQETGHQFSEQSSPEFMKKTELLVNSLQKLSTEEIQKLMQVSEKLAEGTRQRFAEFSVPQQDANSCQALLAFRGDVFSEIAVEHYTPDDFAFAQKHLRILSGLYGILRPLDLIQPYRLEMGGKFKPPKAKNLYEFWRQDITAALQQTCSTDCHTELLNLASNEYFKVVNAGVLGVRIINVFFKQEKNDKLRTIAIHAKKARGALTQYIIKNRLKKSSDLTTFKYAGYSFAEGQSTADELVYIQRG
jgi:cytoplasmic iron level regulating protein YaaA (DUF328/UPF0246 family)